MSFLSSTPHRYELTVVPHPPRLQMTAWFLSTYRQGDAVFLHPEFSPTYWSWNNPVFVHQLVLRWPFPSTLRLRMRWHCFPPRGPEMTLFPSTKSWDDPVFLHSDMTLFSTTRSWDDSVFLHPEMTLFSPTPWSWECYVWHCFLPPLPCCSDSPETDCLAVPLGFFLFAQIVGASLCCPVSVSPGLKYCLPCPIGSTVLSSLTNSSHPTHAEMKTPPHSLTEFGYS